MDNEKKVELKDITIESLEKDGVVQNSSYFDFRLGWMIDNDDVGNIPSILRAIGKVSELDWQNTIRRGECSPGDVSPMVTFEKLASRLESTIELLNNTKN